MLVIAVSEIEISPDEFWNLSWYDWGLYLHRLKVKQEKELRDHNRAWDTTRQMWATLVNLNSKKKVKPQDLIKLSYDEAKKKEFVPGQAVKKFKK